LLGYDGVLKKRFGGPGKVLEFFVSKRVGTLLKVHFTLVTVAPWWAWEHCLDSNGTNFSAMMRRRGWPSNQISQW